MKPIYANVFNSPVPGFEAFRETKIDSLVPITIKESLTDSFSVRNDYYFMVPMFQGNAYKTYCTVVLPEV